MPEVKARVLLWGLEGAGKRTTLETIQARLREELRGEFASVPTRLDPSVTYPCLSIRLGEIGGRGLDIELIAVPGAPDQAMTRKQLLDEIDGIVLVLDCTPGRIEANFESLEELRHALAAYGRTLESLPIVLQYNKRDIADPFAIEDLHRRIGLNEAAVFETIAPTGHGILSTLTTMAKHVLRARQRASRGFATSTPPSPYPEKLQTAVTPSSSRASESLSEPISAPAESRSIPDLLESAILAEGAEADALRPGSGAVSTSEDGTSLHWANDPIEAPEKAHSAADGALRVVSVGQASLSADGAVRLPLVLGDAEGMSRSLVLSLRLDALLDPENGGRD